jgi:type II secretory pathway pseudopilin PulG
MGASRLLHRRYARLAGISMIEMLLVLFLIAIVISLILPAFSSTRFNTRALLCQNNMREIGRGFMDFAQANKQRLPGNTDTVRPRDNPQTASWLFCSINNSVPYNSASPTLLSPRYRDAPQTGTLFEFVRHTKVYRCPSLERAPFGTGLGSNGLFDYGMLNALYGARLDRLPINAFFPYPSDVRNKYDVRLLPIIVEEDPAASVNACCIEADFSNVDYMANTHRRVGIARPGVAANYIASDCSVQFLYRELEVQQARHIWALNTQFGTANFLGFVGPTPVGQWDNGVYANAKPAAKGGIANGTRVPRSELPAAYSPMGAP